MGREQDDGRGVGVFRQPVQQTQAAEARHAHVTDDAAGAVHVVVVEEVLDGAVAQGIVPDGPEDVLDEVAEGRVVIDDGHEGRECVHGCGGWPQRHSAMKTLVSPGALSPRFEEKAR